MPGCRKPVVTVFLLLMQIAHTDGAPRLVLVLIDLFVPRTFTTRIEAVMTPAPAFQHAGLSASLYALSQIGSASYMFME